MKCEGCNEGGGGAEEEGCGGEGVRSMLDIVRNVYIHRVKENCVKAG